MSEHDMKRPTYGPRGVGEASRPVACDSSSCEHEGYHSSSCQYDSTEGELAFVLVCDRCAAVTLKVSSQAYRPSFTRRGNDACLQAA